jgi:hypothetical protein
MNDNTWAWIIGTIVVLLIIGGIWWWASGNNTVTPTNTIPATQGTGGVSSTTGY